MNLNKFILKAGKVLFENEFKIVDIAIEDGRILEIKENLTDENFTEIDCTGLIITPGFMDVHVHLRDPGYTHKEDIKTGTLSAVAGGFTTVYAMPNTNPCMDSEKEIQKFNDKVKEFAYCKVKTYSAISKKLKGEQLVNIKSISKLDIAGFTDDGKGLQTDEKMNEALKEIAKTTKIIAVHAEDESELLNPTGVINEGAISKKYGVGAINNASEYKMFERDLNLLKQHKAAYHLCHLSTKESVKLLKEAINNKLNVTAEVTPHHLVLCDEDIRLNKKNEIDSNYKMNPPLRTKEDLREIIKAFNAGVINIIATDHAPHSEQEKSQNIYDAPFGIIGLEMCYSVLNTYLIKKEKISQEKILRALTYNPAKRFNESKQITKGEYVDLVILDPKQKVIYSKENTYSKSSNSPFMDKELIGKVKFTIIKEKLHDWSSNE